VADTLEAQLAALSASDLAFLEWQRRWCETARPEQIPPESGWTEFGALAGRGFGKTRVGAEWLGRVAYEDPQALPRCVVAPTQADVRFTCFEGESGLLAVIPPECVDNFNRTDLLLTLTNGATIRGFSAEKADRLRGPQHADAWCDELAAWGKDAEETWDMLMFGMRLGPQPRVLWTTTPKPVPIVRKLTAPQDARVIVRGSTYDNRSNLPASFFKALEAYEGTKIGRQELYGELIDPEEAGVIKRSWFRLWPGKTPLPRFDWIIMSLDTAFTERTLDKKGDPDPTACSVWGVFTHERRSNIMLLDCWEDHLGMPDLIRRVKREMNTAYGDDEDQALIKPMFGSSKPLTSGRKPDILLIEDKGSGISLRQMLAEAGIEAYAYNPGRADKLARLHIVSPVFAQRRVWLPESDKHPGRPRTWADPLVSQLCSFTGEGSIKHDDHVDACTQAMRLCLDKGMLRIVSEERQQRAAEAAIDNRPRKQYMNPYAA
jgi:predicted phage terminase large subunit-like protein